MKKIKTFPSIIIITVVLAFVSCDLDNYDGPNATISGGIYDSETKELIRQDIINGAQIEYVEHGFDNPQTQYQIIKSDGTYMNKMMFSGTYTIHLKRGNFIPIEEQEVVVKGNTELDFNVQPYIRIKNAKIEKMNNKIVATFNIQRTVTNKVKKIGIYGHLQDYVGEPSRSVAVEKTLEAETNESTQYTLEIDINSFQNDLISGKQYYFIVGALIDAPEAKLNYAAPVRITI